MSQFLRQFDVSDLSADSVTVLRACIESASGNGFDFGFGDEVTQICSPEFSDKKTGGHLADLVAKGFISGEHLRVNDTGPMLFQLDLREDIKDAAMRYDWRLDEEQGDEGLEVVAVGTIKNGEIETTWTCPCADETSEGETCGDCGRTKLQGAMVTLDPQVRKLHVWLRNGALLAQKRLDEFTVAFTANPTRAMEWCDRTHDDAALVGVALHILVAITNRGAEVKFSELLEYVTRELTRLAATPCRSTSNASRCAHEGQVKAYGEILEKCRFVS